MARILIVEDDESLRCALFEAVSNMKHEVTCVSNAEDALDLLYLNTYDLVLTDLKLPRKSGVDLQCEVREFYPNLPIILMTAHASIDIAVDTLRLGAKDFITKPFSPEHLQKIISRELLLENENKASLEAVLLTKNPKMLEILNLAKKLGTLPTSVLLQGESGSGKEVLAKYIHQNGFNKNSPFVAVNCGSIPKNLMESEFFGYEPGAFTGASNSKEGLFEAAHNGTLFLDEVAEMPISLQVKLLRAIQEGETRRLGDTKAKSVNVRVISATNKNLEEQIKKLEFREDLFYRLGVFIIEIPPLRERREDISLLTEYFLEHFKENLGFKNTNISKEAMKMLFSYDWPGNVRELENILERSLIYSGGDIKEEHLQIISKQKQVRSGEINLLEISQAALRNAETAAILDALITNDGNKTKAAKMLGVSYKTLLTKIKEYNLNLYSVG